MYGDTGLEDLLNEAASQGIPGITAAVATSEGLIWSGVAGVSNLEKRNAVLPDGLFGIGSITKTFIAVVVLQLIAEGRLCLDTTAGSILGVALDGIDNADRATILQLLNHTSAVRSWEDDPAWIRDGRGAFLEPDRIWRRTQPLAYISGQAALGAPGKRFRYSNTNYTILGLMIESVTEQDIMSEIRRRILRPIGITDIYLEGFEALPKQRLPNRYHWATREFRDTAGLNVAFREVRPGLIDVTSSNLSSEWAAGGMLATAGDLARFGVALSVGALLKVESMQLLTQWSPTARTAVKIGHGVFREEMPDGSVLVGHNGGVLGFSATFYWIEGCDAIVAAMANVGDVHAGDVPATLKSVVRSGEFLNTIRRMTGIRSRRSSAKREVMLPPSLKHSLVQKRPTLWCNDRWQPLEMARAESHWNVSDVLKAGERLQRFAGLLVKIFPELESSGGIIESPLCPADRLQNALWQGRTTWGRWLIKADHALPVAGSIKARGGIYEVLVHAEDLAVQARLLRPNDDPVILASGAARSLFSRHQVSVGSTGNLGLSIGVMAAALGFRAVVHMSRDAKPWKKERLRARGVEVIEHDGDYRMAVAAGRAQARGNPYAYFVDDEHSERLFLGYSVAALRLQRQLSQIGVRVDTRHPLFVYLPCGVGGAPGGITFGLRHLFGDNVHCFFAEPVAAPCMLFRLASTDNRPADVGGLGLDSVTEADGLAVGQASEFVAPLLRPLVSGIFTVSDEDLLVSLYCLEQTEGFHVEPSAAAGCGGPNWILASARGQQYLADHGLVSLMGNATHIIWTTGGALVPPEEYRQFHERGRVISAGHEFITSLPSGRMSGRDMAACDEQ